MAQAIYKGRIDTGDILEQYRLKQYESSIGASNTRAVYAQVINEFSIAKL